MWYGSVDSKENSHLLAVYAQLLYGSANAHRHILSCSCLRKVSWGQTQFLTSVYYKSSLSWLWITFSPYSLVPLASRPCETLSIATGPCRADVSHTCFINSDSFICFSSSPFFSLSWMLWTLKCLKTGDPCQRRLHIHLCFLHEERGSHVRDLTPEPTTDMAAVTETAVAEIFDNFPAYNLNSYNVNAK